MSTRSGRERPANSCYEFRVWGKYRNAQRVLDQLAAEVSLQEFDDCYLLGSDPRWNVKVRDGKLKLKRLVAQEEGFECWTSRRYKSAENAPSPFAGMFDELGLGGPGEMESYEISEVVAGWDDRAETQPLLVTKQRRRYHIGLGEAEVVKIDVHDSPIVLKSLAIQGDDLDKLIALRDELGLDGEENLAVHMALENETNVLDGVSVG